MAPNKVRVQNDANDYWEHQCQREKELKLGAYAAKESLEKQLKSVTQQKEQLEGTARILKAQQLMQLYFTGLKGETRLRLSGIQVPEEAENPLDTFFGPVDLARAVSALIYTDDVNVQIEGAKVITSLSADVRNLEIMSQDGAHIKLTKMLGYTKNKVLRHVGVVAVANFARNQTYGADMIKDGLIDILSTIVEQAENHDIIEIVAGAVGNLCQNDELQSEPEPDGIIKKLLSMEKTVTSSLFAENLAYGIVNFARCELKALMTRGPRKANKTSCLFSSDAYKWLAENAKNKSPTIKRHVEVALCYLANYGSNKRKMRTNYRGIDSIISNISKTSLEHAELCKTWEN